MTTRLLNGDFKHMFTLKIGTSGIIKMIQNWKRDTRTCIEQQNSLNCLFLSGHILKQLLA